jgi:isoleucyl-tRNA synthetase
MNLVSKEIQGFSQEQIAELEGKGSIDIAVSGKIIT